MSINKMFVAQKAGDIETTMTVFSDRYSDSQGTTKAMVRQYIGGLIYENVFASMTMSMDDASVSVEDEVATLTPVRYSGTAGNSSWSFQLKREDDGVWRVTNSKQIQ